ncbi:cytochrome c oxidase assembly protein [Rhodococcus pyridinivorans]|uniref:cytochrome c oxidase assembly protein n=1 Tax=Rhodococcus pyridinivorans TaxID=103816 RepID=UPI001906D832|nr:cytochrome c oxidase assembly protein [Rhodococcus pyridinivorans]QQM55737.1 bifunctional copper resistance protein CopD/cytochrome c oxidase assembly protein [Rhodococcus pyridinivorans]
MVSWTVGAAVVAAALAAVSSSEVLRLLGLPDPGVLTRYGLPAATAIGEVAAVVMIGSLLVAAVLVPPQPSGVLDVDGYRAVRTASAAAALWAGSALVLIPLSLSDTSGQPLSTVFADPVLFVQSVGQIEASTAWLWTACLAVVVGLGCRLVLQHRWTPLLLVLAVGTLMPRALTGHSAGGGSHDLATNSLIFHLVAAGLWVGGLTALLLHAVRGGGHLDVATRRFSALATVAFVVMAASGTINALVRVPLGEFLSGPYGFLVLAKVAALGVVGWLGWRQRTVAVTALAVDPSNRRAFIGLAVVESAVLTATIGLGVALGRTPPPLGERREPSLVDEVLGYGFDGAPTLGRLMTEWRFDLLLGTAALVLATLYLLGVRRLRAAGRSWPLRRTASWLLGCLVLLLVTSSGIGRYAPAAFSVHLPASAALAIVVPLCLVLGAPLTLAARAVRPGPRDAVPGARDWMRAIFTSTALRWITHPLVAAVMLVGTFYLLYLGGLYEGGSYPGRMVLDIWLLAVGLVFFWVTVGIDPVPGPQRPLTRVGAAAVALAGYAFFLVALIMAEFVIAAEFYTSLQLGWFDDLAANQRLGGNLAWAVGELPLLLATVLAIMRWGSVENRRARQRDDQVDRDGDRELAAYNAMLNGLHPPSRTSAAADKKASNHDPQREPENG